MAIIISHHIRTNGAMGRESPDMTMPAGMPAPSARKDQQSAAKSPSAPAMSARSCLRTRVVRSSVDDTACRQMEIGELGVLGGNIELHRPTDRAARRAANLSDLVL